MCCGKKRNEYTESTPKKPSIESHRPPEKLWTDVTFEYRGETGLTVKGPVTGRTYRFEVTGDQQQVDYRDARSMLSIPLLRKVPKGQ